MSMPSPSGESASSTQAKLSTIANTVATIVTPISRSMAFTVEPS
ncbi:hypothetical protein BH23CHL7_BH23CHL7_15930 [soil metagenome]